MKTLVIDNNILEYCWGSFDLQKHSLTKEGNTVTSRRAPQGDLPKHHNFDRIIISGSLTSADDPSPWVDELMDYIKKAMDLKIPILGICYGHQLIARILNGKSVVQTAKTAEFGWTKISVINETPILKGLGQNFYSFSSHYQEVVELPKGARHFASSPDCHIQGFELIDSPTFCVQFHPEKSLHDTEQILLELKEKDEDFRFFHAKDAKKYYNPKVGEIIFENFLNGEFK